MQLERTQQTRLKKLSKGMMNGMFATPSISQTGEIAMHYINLIPEQHRLHAYTALCISFNAVSKEILSILED